MPTPLFIFRVLHHRKFNKFTITFPKPLGTPHCSLQHEYVDLSRSSRTTSHFSQIIITMQILTIQAISLISILATPSLAQDWQSVVNSAESLAATIANPYTSIANSVVSSAESLAATAAAPYTSIANSIVSSAQSAASDAVLSATRDASSVVASAQSVAATAGGAERSSALSVASAAVTSADSVASQATRSADQVASSASAAAQATGTNGAGRDVGVTGMGVAVGAMIAAVGLL